LRCARRMMTKSAVLAQRRTLKYGLEGVRPVVNRPLQLMATRRIITMEQTVRVNVCFAKTKRIKEEKRWALGLIYIHCLTEACLGKRELGKNFDVYLVKVLATRGAPI
jgi:hypothetical protein